MYPLKIKLKFVYDHNTFFVNSIGLKVKGNNNKTKEYIFEYVF